MLKMKTSCERCATALKADADAAICSYECTFCPRCAAQMGGVCPNCGGELRARPRRTTGAAAIATRLPGRVRRRIGRRHD